MKLVAPTVPERKTAMVERIKAFRPDGIIQCNRCGCRTMVTETTGAVMLNGKKQRGTVTMKDVCANCYKRDINTPMLPELKKI